MNVTTINITTVRLSNTESKVNYESYQFANRASSPCMQWCGGEPLILIQCSPNRAGRFPITRLTNLIFRGNRMSKQAWKNRSDLAFLCYSSVRHPPCLGPFFPSLIKESITCLSSLISNRACRPASFFNSLPKRRKGWIKRRGYYEPSAPRI